MSDADSLSSMDVSPQRLMPRSQSLAEHHRVLNNNALHAGNSLSTFKAHKIRIDDLEEKYDDLGKKTDELEEAFKTIYEVKGIVNDLSRATSSLAATVSKVEQRQVEQGQSFELKKVLVQGIIAIIIAAVGAVSGYFMAHSPTGPTYQAPTHQQAVQIEQQLHQDNPEVIKQVH